jgi:hypothetical protein
MPSRGRPRLTQADYLERLQSYCTRYGVTATLAGVPPFPSGRRETDQHREWLGLYKAHARLHRPQAGAVSARSADGGCGACGQPVEPADGIPHRSDVLHPGCHAIVTLVEPLGPGGLERLRSYLWPSGARRSPARKRKP